MPVKVISWFCNTDQPVQCLEAVMSGICIIVYLKWRRMADKDIQCAAIAHLVTINLEVI